MTPSQTSSVFSTNVVSLPITSTRLPVFEPCYAWSEPVKKRMEELVQELEHGWDGYRGKPVSLENAWFALRMLEAVCGPDAAPPQIVPGPSGDLQIEWHGLRGDIELHVLGPNRVHAWRYVVGGNEDGESHELTIDFGTVAAWVREMTEPQIAVATAAA